MRICYKILQIIKKHPFATPFLNKVDPIALNIPDYLDIVKEPIDLGKIFNIIIYNFRQKIVL
jgi:bromodomain-containing factor 1